MTDRVVTVESIGISCEYINLHSVYPFFSLSSGAEFRSILDFTHYLAHIWVVTLYTGQSIPTNFIFLSYLFKARTPTWCRDEHQGAHLIQSACPDPRREIIHEKFCRALASSGGSGDPDYIAHAPL